MDAVIDNVARILASSVSRREAFRKIAVLVGTAGMWAVAAKQDVFAASCSSCCTAVVGKSTNKCPDDPALICCPGFELNQGPGGNSNAQCAFASAPGICCAVGHCLCPDTGCSASKGGPCPAPCVFIG
jgi:hypothetical protein